MGGNERLSSQQLLALAQSHLEKNKRNRDYNTLPQEYTNDATKSATKDLVYGQLHGPITRSPEDTGPQEVTGIYSVNDADPYLNDDMPIQIGDDSDLRSELIRVQNMSLR